MTASSGPNSSTGYPYQRVTMTNPPEGLTVERVEVPERYATEEDATHLYQPKGMQYTTSMQQTGFVLPNDVYGPVRNLAVVCLTTSADYIERERCWKQLHRMRDAGDEQAQAALDAMSGLIIGQ